ncbi:DUF935 family protein [Flammeovirga sp. MY04]|uniref:phage portal protein family protein n=1 Tax=Flammeovirga sp. MY04 TaxID=1191459 RepID=UPI00080610E2|nr:DUF935 family protein [Flammeovirga sp. MY04]ANQ49606.1 DUF935 family protein [Flammeovirga sp. MY04]ANQ52124.1 DUF935 family protein [Flammeovirga sp. MY04]
MTNRNNRNRRGGKNKQQKGFYRKIKPKAISRTRKDISNWKTALQKADNVDDPKRQLLIEVYEDIMLDGTLSSQVQQRQERTIGSSFQLINKSGKVDENATNLFKTHPFYLDIVKSILDAPLFGYSLVEFEYINDVLTLVEIDRRHISPSNGRFYPDLLSNNYVPYREANEFGKWLIEFNESEGRNYGVLNKCVPHVLFKKFAQACWSELCEIYGIPPRVLKTNTQDPEQLDRAEAMMRDMGSAAYFIIDDQEEFNFATGVQTDGNVYKNLIQLCNNELSMVISTAIIGQDTKHGNRSKEESSSKLVDYIVKADKRKVAQEMNKKVLPALEAIGFIPGGLTFQFEVEENLKSLWEMTVQAMSHMDVDPNWVKEKFGIQVTGAKKEAALSGLDSFFE